MARRRAVVFASNTSAEIEPRAMRGYGEVPDTAVQVLATTAASLQQFMEQGIALLHGAASSHRSAAPGELA